MWNMMWNEWSHLFRSEQLGSLDWCSWGDLHHLVNEVWRREEKWREEKRDVQVRRRWWWFRRIASVNTSRLSRIKSWIQSIDRYLCDWHELLLWMGDVANWRTCVTITRDEPCAYALDLVGSWFASGQHSTLNRLHCDQLEACLEGLQELKERTLCSMQKHLVEQCYT